MKKFAIIALAACVSACSCFECEDQGTPVVAYQSTRKTQLDCDYFDGKTCYRYVYKNIQRPVAQPAPVRQRPCEEAANSECGCGCKSTSTVTTTGCKDCDKGCEPKITETREPVEVVYKKTSYKTVYEPKTTSEVSYEKVPCSSGNCSESVEVANASKAVLEEVK